MIWSIAWKNVWRNKLRSLIVVASMAIGLWGGVYSVAFMKGMIGQRTEQVINNEASHIQIHHEKFQANNEAEYIMNDVDKILSELENMPEVQAASARTKIMAMANTSGSTAGVMLFGIDPEKEKQVTQLYTQIKDSVGTYFESGKKNRIFIGEKLAEDLKLTKYMLTQEGVNKLKELDVPDKIVSKLDSLIDVPFRNEKKYSEKLEELIGESDYLKYNINLKKVAVSYKMRNKIILTFQNAEGDLVGGAFKIEGIYKTSNSMFDGRNVFLKNSDLARLTHYPENQAHEIAIMLNDMNKVNDVINQLKEKYPNYDIEGWDELAPDIAMYSNYMDFYNIIIILFILFALAFGIINTMLMAVLERVKELGMLMAIGMNKLKVFAMIMLETIFLSFTGAVVGMILSALLIGHQNKYGFDMSMYSEGMEAMGYDSIIYPVLEPSFYLTVSGLVILTGILASLYPARRALKLNPSEAIRTDA